MTNVKEIKKETHLFACLSFSVLALSVAIPGFLAVATLGISSGLAANLYYALSIIGWGATAAAIVSSFGLASFGAAMIWGLVKKWAVKEFVAW